MDGQMPLQTNNKLKRTKEQLSYEEELLGGAESTESKLTDEQLSYEEQLLGGPIAAEPVVEPIVEPETVVKAESVVEADEESPGKEPDEVQQDAHSIIKGFEGYKAAPYKDTAGIWTVGHGHNLVGRQLEDESDDDYKVRATTAMQKYDLNSDGELDTDEAETLYVADLASHQSWRNSVKVPLNEMQQIVMTSLEFNKGRGALGPLIKLVNAGDHTKVAAYISELDSTTHARRREAEAKLYLSSAPAATATKKPKSTVPTKLVETGATEFSFGGTKWKVPTYEINRPLTLDEQRELALRGIITPNEINKLAKKYGVDSKQDIEQLKDLATYFGATVPKHIAPTHAVIGFLGDTFAFGLPQKATIEQIFKKPRSSKYVGMERRKIAGEWQMVPKYELGKVEIDEKVPLLLDELRQLAISRKSKGRMAAEIITSMASPAILTKAPKALAALSGTMAAVHSGATAPRGEEWDRAYKGFLFGAPFGYAIGRYSNKAVQGATGKQAHELSTPAEHVAARTIDDLVNELPTGAKADLHKVTTGVWKSKRNTNQHLGLVQVLKDAALTMKKGSKNTDLLSIDRFTDSLNQKPALMASFINPSKLGKLKAKLGRLETATADERAELLMDPRVNLVLEGFTPKQVIAHEGFTSKMTGFANHRGLRGSYAELVKQVQEQSVEHFTKLHKDYVEGDAMIRYLNRFPENNKFGFSEFRNLWTKLHDGHMVGRQLDQKYNLNIETTIANMSDNLKDAQEYSLAITKRADLLWKKTKKSGISQRDIGEALETRNGKGNIEWTPPGQKHTLKYHNKTIDSKIYDEWAALYEDARVLTNEAMGVNIPKFGTKTMGYLTAKRMDTIDYILVMDKWIKRVRDDDELMKLLDTSTNSAWAKAQKTDKVKFMMNEMQMVLGEKPKNATRFNELMEALVTPRSVREGLNTRATTMMQRTGRSEIHPELREWDAVKLINYWANSTLKHLAVRDGMSELAKVQRTLGNKDKFASEYIRNLRKDISGAREDRLFADSIGSKLDKFDLGTRRASEQLSKQGYPVAAGAVEFTRYLPDIIKLGPRMIYANLLGGSIRSAQQNAFSAYFQSLPELGNQYGGKVLQKAVGRTWNMLLKGETIRLRSGVAKALSPSPNQVLKLDARAAGLLGDGFEVGQKLTLSNKQAKLLEFREGEQFTTKNWEILARNARAIGPQWNGEMERAMIAGSKDALAWKLSQDGLDKVNNGLMYLFKKSEEMARIQTKAIADEVSSDLLRNADGATTWLRKLSSPDFRRKIASSVASKDVEETNRLVNQYFQSSNMFNYDKVNMSAYGRYGGPFLSTFTKWPSAMAGKMTHELLDRGDAGQMKFLQQFLAPFAVMQTFDYGVLPEPGTNPTVDLLLGQGQLSNMVGISSVLDMFNFEQGTLNTPAGQALTGLVKGFKSDYKGSFSKSAQKVGSMYLPLAGYLRVFGEDMARMSGVDLSEKYPHHGKLTKQWLELQRLGTNVRDIPEQLLKTVGHTELLELIKDPEYAKQKAVRAINPLEKHRERLR